MYCPINTYRLIQKKIWHAHFNTNKPFTNQKIVYMNVDISETIEDRKLVSQI